MLLDTSGLLCLIHRSEVHHDDACAWYRSTQRRLTHNYVLAEFIALARARRLPANQAIAFIADLVANP